MREYTLKEKIGCISLDLPRLAPALLLRKQWIKASNRGEALQVEEGGVITDSLGPWSSDIYACHVYPWIGRRLMHNALHQWPVGFTVKGLTATKPDVSFVIPHRGADRLPLLIMVVRSILAQIDASVECVVVEQNDQREVYNLPEGVKYIHLPHPTDPAGWMKSWAFNVGVDAAKADIVVCHDGDILLPRLYAREVLRHIKDGGFESAHLQRFLFCLGRTDTHEFIESCTIRNNITPERVRQNWQGGTLAIRKAAFEKIGGYDERFVGWGGEDNEFFDRCKTLRSWRRGYLPFVHLWHEPQAGKVSNDREENLQFLRQQLRIAPDKRIGCLKSLHQITRQCKHDWLSELWFFI